MKIERMTEIETTDIQIGDRIHVGHYTATCQDITPKGAIFLLDQYLDRPMPMNKKNTNHGGYDNSDLRKYLQSDTVLSDFEEIRPYMKPWNNGDLLRIPYYGEMFDNNDRDDFVEPDSNEQWPLMKDAHNRMASRCGEPEWGWLANTARDSSADFCNVGGNGSAYGWYASDVLGVRPAFLIEIEALDCSESPNSSDTISRQAAIDAVKKNTFRLTFAEEQNCEGHVAWSAEAVYSDVMEGALLDLPSAQPEPAIPLQWIEAQIEWLKSLDNAFSTLTAGQISAMVNKWEDEQDG